MNKVVFIADFFADQVLGGGELNNEELISLLRGGQFTVQKTNSQAVDLNFLKENSTSFLIISNFVGLDYQCREWITKNSHYIIYEHDHKYLASRNPASYENFKAPAKEIRNYFFYKNAKRIFCQSDFHKDILEKNLELPNVVSLGGNLWPLDTLKKLKELSKVRKKEACSIMKSSIPHKNTNKSIQYCKNKDLEYDLVNDKAHDKFLEKLGKNQILVFFPGTPETLSRVVCEARMMGMSVVTNQLVGATQEKWFNLKGEPLVEYMINKREEICNLVINEIKASHKKISLPKKQKEISIISTFCDGSKYLEKFLEDITSQTIFDKCELILVDAASVGQEKEIIKKYKKQYDNIKHYRLEEKLLPTPSVNIAIKKADAKYLTFAFIDDRKKNDCLETLLREIKNSDADLVYGDVLQTKVDNETYDNNSSTGELFEHSTYNFSKENMVKCLPGPMPLWKKSIHEKCGFFDEDGCDFADDWDMWLRAVNNGSKFKKTNKIVGLYLKGGRSQQDKNIKQAKEEAKIFYKYSHLFGDSFSKHEPYFRQFLEMPCQ